jgi:PAS domain S-box-containing protein
MAQPLKVLMAEDNPDDAELVLRALRQAGFEPACLRVDTEAAFQAQLQGDFDLVLSDYQMPQFSGLRALQLVSESGRDLPFILISGTIGEDTAVAAMKDGAADYLLKDRLTRLGAAVTQALAASHLRREKVRAEEMQRITHAQLRQVLEQSPAVLYVLKLAGGRIVPHLVSENITTLLGFTVAEASTHEWWVGQLHPDDRELATAGLAETLKKGTNHTEYRLRHKDGHYCWVSDTQRLIRSGSGEAIKLIGVWTDITERRRAEETLRQASRHVMRNRRIGVRIELGILAGLTAIFYLLAAHFNWFAFITLWIVANDLARLDEISFTIVFLAGLVAVFIFRRSRETASELTTHHQVEAALSLLHSELDRQVRQRTDELDKSNQALRAEIVDHERADRALRESETQFRQVVENIHEVFWIFDLVENRSVYLSPAFEKIWGRSCVISSATPRPRLEGIHPDDRDRILRAEREKLALGTYEEEYRIEQPDGTIRWIHDRAFPVRDATAAVHRIVGVAEDITARKQLEEQYRQAQKMEAIGTLAGGIAHDFNNILAAITGYTELARMTLTGNPDVREHLGAVLRAASRATDLIRQILTFSRQQPQERRPIQLQPVVAETIALLRATIPSTIEFDIDLAADAPTVLADATQINQLLMNLGTNAWHAIKDQPGRLQVRLERCVIDAAAAAVQPRLAPGVYAHIAVRDTGHGMSPATLRRIFEPFFTTKPLGEGTGLGLAVLHGIMDSHDGIVTVESQPGVGTCFHLYFPAYAGEALATPAKNGPVPRGRGERLLVVDDEEVIALLLQKTLTALGYEGEYATEPGAALARIRSEPGHFSVLLTDQTMPGMNGLQLATQVRLIQPGLPVLMMTGYTTSAMSAGVEAAGVRELLSKPISVYALGVAVHAAIGATRSAPLLAT